MKMNRQQSAIFISALGFLLALAIIASFAVLSSDTAHGESGYYTGEVIGVMDNTIIIKLDGMDEKPPTLYQRIELRTVDLGYPDYIPSPTPVCDNPDENPYCD